MTWRRFASTMRRERVCRLLTVEMLASERDPSSERECLWALCGIDANRVQLLFEGRSRRLRRGSEVPNELPARMRERGPHEREKPFARDTTEDPINLAR